MVKLIIFDRIEPSILNKAIQVSLPFLDEIVQLFILFNALGVFDPKFFDHTIVIFGSKLSCIEGGWAEISAVRNGGVDIVSLVLGANVND